MTSPEAARRRGRRSDRPAKGDLREQTLLETAHALLATGGFAAASVADLAAGAGISRAAFYFYFASKEALLASVLDRSVQGFNDRIVTMFDPATEDMAAQDPIATVSASVEAAADLWWDHAPVLCATFELGTRLPEVYERTQANLAVVREPTSALLQRSGRVPEAGDPAAADALVLSLLFMSERTFYHLMRSEPTLRDRRRATATLVTIWLRAFGFDAATPARPPLTPTRAANKFND